MTGSSERPPDTLFVGAPTRLGYAINDLVRQYGAILRESGVSSFPNKSAIHALRAAIGDNPDPGEIEALMAAAPEKQLFLSALYALGRPATALRKNELFPEAERMLGGVADVLGGRIERVVVAIEPVHHLLLSARRDKVLLRPGQVQWEVLYEVSWAELIDVVSECFPEVDLVVLTPHAAKNGAAPVLHHLFGTGGFELAAGEGGDAVVSASRMAYEPNEIKEKTGLDQVACDLLEQRFSEDIEVIAARAGVRVL